MITEYKEFLRPKKVYIPLTDKDFKIATVKVEEDEKVVIGQVIAKKFKGKESEVVLSSVSGKVIGFEVLEDRYGKKVDHCVIENDFDSKKVETAAYEDATASEIRRIIKEFGLTYINEDGSYTPISFDKEVKHVVVNGVFINEPHYSVDYSFVANHAERIANGISLIAKAALCESVTLLIDKTMPKEVLELVGIATVDRNINLVLVDPRKFKGQDIKLITNLVRADLSPNLLNSGVIYTDIDAAKMINNAVVDGEIPTSRTVAITGDGLKQNVMYEVKFGVLISDLVDDLEGYNEVEEMVMHIGDFITGNQVTSDRVAITQTVNSVNVSEYVDVEVDVCDKCGDCNDICPVGILPQNIMDAELRGVNSRIVELQTELCTECGLCSYVCPSKINVLEWVRRAKRRVG